MKAPRRKRKGDRLLSPGASTHEVRCDYALAPFDELSREMEMKWGIERLPGLVPPEMAERYGSAIDKLNVAIDSDDPEQVKTRAAVCIRGLRAMDTAATEAGARLADPDVWEYEINGRKIAIIRDGREWQSVKKDRPELVIYTMREVAIALAAYQFDGVVETKKHFPAAQIEKITTKEPVNYEAGGDPIPF